MVENCLHVENPDPPLHDRFLELMSAGFSRKPILHDLIRKLGTKNLYEYVAGYKKVELSPRMAAKQEEFLEIFGDEVTKRLGADAARRSCDQLRRTFMVSTNDHHGPLNAFDIFNAHLVLAIRSMEQPDERLDYIIALSCGNVSLNNVTFPRGFLFHAAGAGGSQTMQRLSFLPSNSHASPMFGCRSYTATDVQKISAALRLAVREGRVPQQIAQKLQELIGAYFNCPEILGAPYYTEQVTRINDVVWEEVFKGHPHHPSLVTIEQEWIVARLLSEKHLGKGTMIDRLFFGTDSESLLLKYFNEMYGAFSSTQGWGTYLFWALPKGSKLRMKMRKEGTELVSDDGTYRIPLEGNAIAAALQNREIIPGLLLTFVTLSFTYGLKCLGGYSQVNYLTYMKETYMRLLTDVGEPEEAQACEMVSTKNWSGFTFSYIQSANGSMLPATFLDVYLYGDCSAWQCMSRYAKECTLEKAVYPLMPQIYRYSYPERERDPALMNIEESDVLGTIGVKPCLQIA